MKNEEFLETFGTSDQGRAATAKVDWQVKNWWMKAMQMLLCAAFFILHSSFFISCSEEEAVDEFTQEFANWQARNDAYFATLEDSLLHAPGQWVKLKSISLDQTTQGAATDYVYALKLDSGLVGAIDNVFAKSTDSVRVSYEGRLMPSGSIYPDGMVFDGTVFGTYNQHTNANAKFLVSGLKEGFSTAIQHMRKGDYWRIYVPYNLGYGSAGSGKIPGYSTLIFDVTLLDISPVGHAMAPWSQRRR